MLPYLYSTFADYHFNGTPPFRGMNLEPGFEVDLKVEQTNEQPGDVKITWADMKKSHAVLDIPSAYPLKKGIEEFVDWYRKFKKKE